MPDTRPTDEKMVSQKTADFRVASMAGIVSGYMGWRTDHESPLVALLHYAFVATCMWFLFRLLRKLIP